MLAGCGAVGGIAAWLSDTTTPGTDKAGGTPIRNWASFITYVLAGMLAAFVVPLFLRLADSGLMDRVLDPNSNMGKPADPWVLAGFALVAAFTSKTFIQSVSNRVLAMAEAARNTAIEAKATAEESKITAGESADRSVVTEEVVENLRTAAEPVASVTSNDARRPERTTSLDELTEPERKVLDALANEHFTRRTASGVARDVKLTIKTVRAILEKLHELGFVEREVSTRSGNSLYLRIW